jgi:hypothetical protein
MLLQRGSLLRQTLLTSAILSAAIALSACSPKIAIETPKEPITINLNVKIEHEILIKVDKQIDTLFSEESDLF